MFKRFTPTPIAFAAFLTVCGAHAQETPKVDDQKLGTITVNASADASADGLSKPYAGGQVARGGRAGILGTQDNLDVPFNITSYTNELIQDQQARTIGDVLKNDSSVRVARGFGNFQESYFIRGFILASDEVAYNGLYSILPRQSIATELVERVEVLRGASAFLTGAAPGGGGIGGTINLVPKRAPNEALSRVTVSGASGQQYRAAADVARRFGPNDSTGIRINAVRANGGTGVDRENVDQSVISIGADWRSSNVRISADIGHQDNRLKRTRPSVAIGSTLTAIPDAPSNTSNWAQDWTYSNERDTFGTLRGEYDFNANWTGWAAFGMRQSTESNSLSGFRVNSALTGNANTYRADNYREDTVKSGEVGVRGKLRTGSVGHTLVASASTYRLDSKNAYAWSPYYALSTNLYNPVQYAAPATTGFSGGDLNDPLTTTRIQLDSMAIGDTMSFIDDRLLLTVGVRHQNFDVRGYDYNTGVENDDSYERSRNSPVLGMVWKIQGNLSVYANYIESLSQGGTAASTATNAGEIFAPFVSKQKEVGIKYDGGNIGGSLAYFTTDKPSIARDAGGADNVSGEDRHQGLELSVYGKATRDLTILGGITLLDAEQRKTSGGTNDGNKVIGVPDVQANLGFEWRVPGLQGLSLDTQIVSTGSSYADGANTLKVSGWTRLDLGARYLTEVNGKVLTLRARIDNVTDRDYWASVGGYPGNGYLTLGNPRTLTVSASMDF